MANNTYTNETVNVNSQCKVVVYPWVTDPASSSTSDKVLAEATRLDISSQIQSMSFSKNIGEPAGTFSILLTNSPGIGSNDWKDILRRGYWLVIYMSQDGELVKTPTVSTAKIIKGEASKIRAICYIERAGIKSETGEDKGDTDISFEITGRDFGIVYEESTIWHNLFQFDGIMLDSIKNNTLNIVGNVSITTALNTIHDLFYYPSNIPGAVVNSNKSMLSIGLQWLLPKEMLVDVGFNLSGLNKGTYWGALPGVKNFSKTGFNIAIEKPTDFLTGNAWEQLKKMSVPAFHELFCETTTLGLPQLTFRPIPWAIDKSAYPTLGQNITLYRNLSPVITIPSKHLYTYDLAEDDHARYNSFLVTVSTSFVNINDNITYLTGSRFPFHEFSSIKRHGFRPMHVNVDSMINNNQLANGEVNRALALECNEINYDYWNQAVFAETGHLTKLGTNDVKLGIAVEFTNDNPYIFNKRYYLEGYTDSFNVNEKGAGIWTQELMLTRGFDKTALQNKSGFSKRPTAFEKPGEFTPGGSN
jgi:hypothetical protein